MTDAPTRIYLGTISIPDVDESLAFSIPPNATAEEITAALEKLEADRAAAQLAESRRIAALFPIAEVKPLIEDKSDE
jgi:hypothetical protein